MDLLTRLESELLAQLQELPPSHPLKQPGRQPIYANELQAALADEGLAPVQPNFLGALLKRLPPRGLDTSLDVSRWLAENQSLLNSSPSIGGVGTSAPTTPARGRSRATADQEAGSPLERVKAKESRQDVAQLLDLLERSVPDVGSLFLTKDENLSGQIGVTELLEILTELNLNDSASLGLLKKAAASTKDGVIPYTEWLRDTSRTSSRRKREAAPTKPPVEEPEAGGARKEAGAASSSKAKASDGDKDADTADKEVEIDTSVVLEDAAPIQSESVIAPDPPPDEETKKEDAAEDGGGGDDEQSGGKKSDADEDAKDESKEAASDSREDGGDKEATPTPPDDSAAVDAEKQAGSGTEQNKLEEKKLEPVPDKKPEPLAEVPKKDEEAKPEPPSETPPAIELENLETDGQLTPSPLLQRQHSFSEEPKTADAETQAVPSARQPQNLIMTNSPKNKDKDKDKELFPKTMFSSGVFGVAQQAMSAASGGGSRPSQEPGFGRSPSGETARRKSSDQTLTPGSQFRKSGPASVPAALAGDIPAEPFLASNREVEDLLLQDATDWRLCERFFRSVEVIENTTVYTEAVCVDEPVSEQRIDDFVRLRKMRKICASSAGTTTNAAAQAQFLSSTGSTNPNMYGRTPGRNDTASDQYQYEPLRLRLRGSYSGAGGTNVEEDDGSPNTSFLRNTVPSPRTQRWVPPSVYEPAVAHFEDHFANTTTACGVTLSKHRVHWRSATEIILADKYQVPAFGLVPMPQPVLNPLAASSYYVQESVQDPNGALSATIAPNRQGLEQRPVSTSAGPKLDGMDPGIGACNQLGAADQQDVGADASAAAEDPPQQSSAQAAEDGGADPSASPGSIFGPPVAAQEASSSGLPAAVAMSDEYQYAPRPPNVDPQSYCVGQTVPSAAPPLPQMIANSLASLSFVVPPRLFSALQPSDLEQGLGDSSFVQAVRVICERCPELILRAFGAQRDSHAGANGPYVVYLFHPQKNYCREEVVLNDLVPCINGYPVFSTNRGGELWSFLLEKAVAKMLGGYHNLNGVGIPLLWNMLAGLQFEDLEAPPFRVLYTWRPQRVVYGELPDTGSSSLVLWGEGTFTRDLASYRYSEPAANCLTSRNVLEYLGRLVAMQHLMCATFVPENPYNLEFGTYVSILRVDPDSQLVWFRGLVHPDAPFGDEFRERFESDLEKISTRFGQDRANARRKAEMERKMQLAKEKLLNSIGKGKKPVKQRKSAPAVLSPTQRKKLLEEEERLRKLRAQQPSSSSSASSSSAGSSSEAESSASSSASSSSAAGQDQENDVEEKPPATDDFDDPRNPFSYAKEDQTKAAQTGTLLKQTANQLALADRKKFAVSFAEFEKYVYDIQYCEHADLVHGSRQPVDWKEQAVFNTIRGVFSSFPATAAKSPSSVRQHMLNQTISPTSRGSSGLTLNFSNFLRNTSENTCYDVFRALVRPEFEEFGIDQLRWYVLVNRWNPRLSERDLGDLWRECDADQDNFLNYVEFFRLFDLSKTFCRPGGAS
ncbi:unnamed protein product [Amoebophrya sp. A120]|nr:unnamed protein product [Amoebophrya sp. A120]|eukprot:GSA120T00018914001.1